MSLAVTQPDQTCGDAQADTPSGPRLLVISNMWPSASAPAFGSFVSRQVDALRRAGADVSVVANRENRRGAIRSAIKYSSLSLRARRAARDGRFDAVVGHFLYPTAVFARDAARRAGAPLVLVAHGTDARSVAGGDAWARRSRTAMCDASLVVAVSSAVRDALRATAGVPDTVPIEVLNMGFDERTFLPDPDARLQLGIAESERVVLFVGNLEPVKGVDLLLKAFLEMHALGQADRLVLIGEGSMGALLRRSVPVASEDTRTEPRRTARVEFLGALEQSVLARWMAAADVLVLPSRQEGLGLVLLEAMACGTPCVASSVGGVPEIMDDSCGRLVPPEDVESLRDGIRTVLELGKAPFEAACTGRAAHHTASAKAEEFLGRLGRLAR